MIVLVAAVVIVAGSARSLLPRHHWSFALLFGIELFAAILGTLTVITWLTELEERLSSTEVELSEQGLKLQCLHETALASRVELELMEINRRGSPITSLS